MGGDRVKHHLIQSPMQLLWFERFSQGCVHCMGQDMQQDWVVPLDAMCGLMNRLEDKWISAEDDMQHE